MLKSRLLKPIAVLALIGALSAGCSLFNSNTTTSDAPEPLIVSETSVPVANVAEGHLVPARHAELPFANGGVVAAFAVEKGQSVKAGDILVTSKEFRPGALQSQRCPGPAYRCAAKAGPAE